jgi:hypothetical protein
MFIQNHDLMRLILQRVELPQFEYMLRQLVRARHPLAFEAFQIQNIRRGNEHFYSTDLNCSDDTTLVEQLMREIDSSYIKVASPELLSNAGFMLDLLRRLGEWKVCIEGTQREKNRYALEVITKNLRWEVMSNPDFMEELNRIRI